MSAAPFFVYLNLAGDEKSTGGIGPLIEGVVLFGDGRTERGGPASVSCIGIDKVIQRR